METMQTELAVERLECLAQTTNRHHLLTEPKMAAVVSIEAAELSAVRHYFTEKKFTEVVVPHITRITGACENIDTLFSLNYFGEDAFLVQTGQLYLESLIPRLGNVFCIGPSFRAEPDVDSRHLTEFSLVEIEFPGDFSALLEHTENMIYGMLHEVLENRREELELLNVDVARLEAVKLPFRRMTYTEAIEKLQKLGIDVKWGDDLKSSQEKLLVADGQPIFITHYPEAIKFFNMRRNPNNPLLVNSSDLLLPGVGEAVGAAEREWDYKLLIEKLTKSQMYKRLQEKGKSLKDFNWYLELIKAHPMQHSGCGIGLNRVTQWILGTNDISTSTAYPMNRLSLM